MRRRKWLHVFSISLVLTGLLIFLYLNGYPFLDLMELKSLDARFLSRGQEPAGPFAVLATIDERSLDEIGKWPWPRARIADLIDRLSEEGAKVIAMDIVFPEPDENNNLRFVEWMQQQTRSLGLKEPRLERLLRGVRAEADNDSILAAAIRRSKARVVLGYFFHFSGGEISHLSEEERASRAANFRVSAVKLVQFTSPAAEEVEVFDALLPESNINKVAEATRLAGYYNIFPDIDGTVRWIPLVIRYQDRFYPALSLEAVRAYVGNIPLKIRVADYGIETIQLGPVTIPTDELGRLLINFRGAPHSFPHYSVADILAGRTPPGAFKDRMVFVGSTALGIYDLRVTPFSSVYPGLEVHANAADNILKQTFLFRPGWASFFDLAAILLMGLVTGFVLPWLRALYSIILIGVLFVGYLLVSQSLFVSDGIWLNAVYPLLTTVVVYTAVTLYRYIVEEREKKKIRGAFSFYVTPSVVNEMLKNPDKLKLGGDKKELTVLFSDIRGFTTLAEEMAPEALVHLLNEYLTEMTDVVFEFDGLLDKYIGDAIMAVFGAPLEQRDHAVRACRTALNMLRRLATIQIRWEKEGAPRLDIGIGINTGPMVVGNMGSERRFDYTVIGDAVNLASRLEGINKEYGSKVVISEFTYEQVKEDFFCRELDAVRVKGKARPVKIFELLALRSESDSRVAIIERFVQGLRYYRAQQWDEAEREFRESLASLPEDHAAELYLQRIAVLREEPPPAEWDGVFTMKRK
ncbi:MAG: adenylate/guanylate cyclase domain-containing protein [Deltaproteobacteria bacterium]|nr:MAG: adenylate/guanylate cyclase domain-containing protein [Deltaproteobacteria bacterium]